MPTHYNYWQATLSLEMKQYAPRESENNKISSTGLINKIPSTFLFKVLYMIKTVPAGTQRNNNFIITSKVHHSYVIMAVLLHRVSAGIWLCNVIYVSCIFRTSVKEWVYLYSQNQKFASYLSTTKKEKWYNNNDNHKNLKKQTYNNPEKHWQQKFQRKRKNLW